MTDDASLQDPPDSAAPDTPAQADEGERFTEDYLPFLLAQASAMVCAEFTEAVRGARLSGIAWRVLATLYDDDALTIGSLARIVLAIQPRVTQVIKKLEGDGLVVRERDKGDRRRTIVRITERGRRDVQTLMSSAKICERSAARTLSSEDLACLKRLLRELLSDRPAHSRGSEKG